MASNTVLDAGAGGDTVVTKERTHDGDASKQQGVFLSGVSGTEGAYTFVDVDAGGGVEANALRVTIASDSTGVVSVDDNGGSLTVDGTVTANLSATDNAVLDAIAASVAGTLTVGSHAVTNAGTFAVQATGTVDLGATDNAVLDAIAASVAGTLTVGSHAVTNAGTFAVQNTAQASTNTQEMVGDAAHDAAAAGNPLLTGAYASAAAPTDVSADGDAVRLWALRNGSQVVNIAAAGALIGATSNALDVNIKSGAGSGGTAMTDDAAYTAATTSFTPVGGIVTADSVDSGDGGAFAMLANRQQKVTLYDSGGVELAVGGGTQYTEDAVAAANPVGNALMLVREDARGGSLTTTDGDNVAARGTNAGELYVKHVDAIPITDNAGSLTVDGTVTANLAAGTNNIGDVDILTIAAGDNNIGNVDIVTMPNVTLAAGTNTNEMVGDAAHDAAAAGNPVLGGAYASAAAPTDVSADGDVTRLWALRNGSQVVNLAYGGTLVTASTVQETVGDVADDAATAGNPVLIGGVAVETDGTDPTTVSAEGDAAYLRTDRARRLLVSQHHPRGWHVSADYGAAQTNASIKAAPGAGLKLYITDISISNGATAGNVTLLDGSGGTVLFEIYPAINGGIVYSPKTPIVLTANTALCITSTTVTTHSVNIGGYIAP